MYQKITKTVGFAILFQLILFTQSKPVIAILKDVYKFEPQNQQKVELTPNKTIEFEFISPVDEFGAIWLKFYKPSSSTSDRVEFKIKSQEAKEWYHEEIAQLDQQDFFQKEGFYHAFGLPKIENAQNKTYVVRLTTLEKNKEQYTSLFTSEEEKPIFKLSWETDAKQIIINDIQNKFKSERLACIFWFGLALLLIWQLLKN